LAKNRRLIRALGEQLHAAQTQFAQTGQAARVFRDFEYRTHKSWSRARRVVGKAEHLAKGANPRFVVTSLSAEAYDARTLYEQEYCARGEMENRIKEQQLYLVADRTSAATMRANQLRLWLSGVACTLLQALRQLGLANTELAHARCDTIRLKLLKIGARMRVTVRRVALAGGKLPLPAGVRGGLRNALGLAPAAPAGLRGIKQRAFLPVAARRAARGLSTQPRRRRRGLAAPRPTGPIPPRPPLRTATSHTPARPPRPTPLPSPSPPTINPLRTPSVRNAG
jgi:hypothetical protein